MSNFETLDIYHTIPWWLRWNCRGFLVSLCVKKTFYPVLECAHYNMNVLIRVSLLERDHWVLCVAVSKNTLVLLMKYLYSKRLYFSLHYLARHCWIWSKNPTFRQKYACSSIFAGFAVMPAYYAVNCFPPTSCVTRERPPSNSPSQTTVLMNITLNSLIVIARASVKPKFTLVHKSWYTLDTLVVFRSTYL